MRTVKWLVLVVVLTVVLTAVVFGRAESPSAPLPDESPTATSTTPDLAQVPTATSLITATVAPTATSISSEPTQILAPAATLFPAATPTTTPEPLVAECLLPPAVDTAPEPDASRTATIGELLTLDGTVLFGIGSAEPVEWARMELEADSLVYSSAHEYVIERLGPLAVVKFDKPGKYRIVATSGSQEFDVEVVVKPESGPAVQAVFFPDLFDNNGGLAFKLQRDDPSCQQTVFDHAFGGAVRAGAEWVGFSPAFVTDQVDPVPRFDPLANSDLSLTDDAYYAELVGAAKDHGLRVMVVEQDGGPSLNLDVNDWLNSWNLAKDPVWLEAWFDELRKWEIPRARRSEAVGVDLYVVDWSVTMTFHPDNGYDRLWRKFIADIREVYFGDIGVAFDWNPDERFTFADAVDVIVIGLFAGAFPGQYVDPENPTYAEAYRETALAIDRAEPFVGDAKVYYFLGATSSNGQVGSEDVAEIAGFAADFQEQSLLYEAFFDVISERPWIEGALMGSFDWFDQYTRPPEELYFDQTTGASPRSKPAEEVIRLWFDGG